MASQGRENLMADCVCSQKLGTFCKCAHLYHCALLTDCICVFNLVIGHNKQRGWIDREGLRLIEMHVLLEQQGWH